MTDPAQSTSEITGFLVAREITREERPWHIIDHAAQDPVWTLCGRLQVGLAMQVSELPTETCMNCKRALPREAT